MIILLGLILSIAVSLCWYLPCVMAQKEKVLRKRDYVRITLVNGLLFSCLLIIITEVIWDAMIKRTPLSGLALELAASFFRAALLEEFFKFWGFKLAKRKLGLHRKIDYVLAAGLIGLVYGVVEKAVLGNIAAVFVGLAIPLHIIWQFNQGAHYYEYEKAKEAGNMELARKEWIQAILVIFFLHGCWDAGLSIAYALVDIEPVFLQVLGAVLLLALLLAGIRYTIQTVKMVRRIAYDCTRIKTSPGHKTFR